MLSETDPGDLLATLSSKYRGGEWPSRGELDRLLRLCLSPGEGVREAALILLIHPPVSNDLTYYHWLFCTLARLGKSFKDLPGPLVEVLCELAAILQRIPGDDGQTQSYYARLLGRLPPIALRDLLHKSLPLWPFLLFGRIDSAIRPKNTSAADFKRKWRLFRKGILERRHKTPPWAQITLRDISTIGKKSASRVNPVFRKGRWLVWGRTMLLPVCEGLGPARRSGGGKRAVAPLPPPSVMPSGLSSHTLPWEALGNVTMRFWEALFHSQVKELQSIGAMARNVSHETRRVVLSWHNATLAAAGGWAFEDLRGSFPSQNLWRVFLKRVSDRLEAMEHGEKCFNTSMEYLWKLWERRLVFPKMLHALWEGRIRAAFDPLSEKQWEKDYLAVEGFLEPELLKEVIEGRRFCWHGAVSPHQALNLGQILTWHSRTKAGWKAGLLRLMALILEGQRLLDEGRLKCLVLPWIDKFFISSLRQTDHEYLPRLVEWIESQGLDPIILFWEDTSHGETPSFQLALESFRKAGCLYRGVGIFDSQGSKRQDALDIVRNEHRLVRLFALRPCADHHQGISFERLLKCRDYRFFETYDTSWKDNLCFLYTGTQVAPLLSVQCEMEPFPGWVRAGKARRPFGSCFREGLRSAVLGGTPAALDPFSSKYAHWANLE